MGIGTIVARARAQAGLTQRQMAERAGTSQPAVARIERGQGSPSVATVERLVRAAGFDMRIEFSPQTEWHDPVVEAYKRDVDRTLLRDNLRKSVDRRMRDIEAFARDAAELRRAVSRGKRK